MRIALISLCVTALLATAVGAHAGESHQRAIVSTTIFQDDVQELGNKRFRFFGHIESYSDDCLPDRTVKMKKKDGGKWILADKTKTDVEGDYATVAKLPGEPPLKFTVTEKQVGDLTCESDSIKPFGGR
jgi:hypothetical protein